MSVADFVRAQAPTPPASSGCPEFFGSPPVDQIRGTSLCIDRG